MKVEEVPAYVFSQLVTEPETVPDIFGEAQIGECHEDGGLTAWLRLSTASPLTTLSLCATEAVARQPTLKQPALICVEAGFGDNRLGTQDRHISPQALRIVNYELGVAAEKSQAVRRGIGFIVLRQTFRAGLRIPDITFIKSNVDILGAQSRNS